MKDEIDGVMEMLSSLNVATQKAGGTVYNWDILKKMTVAELIKVLGPNKVRFQYSSGHDSALEKDESCHSNERGLPPKDIHNHNGLYMRTLQLVLGALYQGKISSEDAEIKLIQKFCKAELAAFVVNAFNRGWISKFNLGLDDEGEII